jgi:hypothetical protein
MTIHLTLTGIHAGRTLCGAQRNSVAEHSGDVQYAHAIYAPVERAEYRALCCVGCMKEFALSWEADEEKPHWVSVILDAETQDVDPRQQLLFA